jgi:hypothetical protein
VTVWTSNNAASNAPIFFELPRDHRLVDLASAAT